MNRLIRTACFAAALVVAAPGMALAAGANCAVPVVTLVQPGTSAVYAEWTSEVTDVVDFTVTLEQAGATIDEQNVSADATSATFFAVAIGEDYYVLVTANTADGSYTSVASDPVAVTEAYIVVDPPIVPTTKLDPSTVSVVLSEDGQSWILSIPAIDQKGERALYGFVTADGQTCWGFSPEDAVEGDVVSCDISLLEDGSTPEVTEAYYQQDWVMYYAMRDGGIVTTTVPTVGDDGEDVTPINDTETTTPVPSPYVDFVATSAHANDSTPNTLASVAVLALGLVGAFVVLRPRRVVA